MLKIDNSNLSIKEAALLLIREKVVVHPTDTVFGISGKYDSRKAYEEIYLRKKRLLDKPLGILLSSPSEIMQFTNLSLTNLEPIFPLMKDGMTVLIPRKEDLPLHLVNQSDFIAVRIPNQETTKELLKLTGPLMCSSANIAGESPIRTYQECINSFGKDIPFVPGKVRADNRPSSIIKWEKGSFSLVREGAQPKKVIEQHTSLI